MIKYNMISDDLTCAEKNPLSLAHMQKFFTDSITTQYGTTRQFFFLNYELTAVATGNRWTYVIVIGCLHARIRVRLSSY